MSFQERASVIPLEDRRDQSQSSADNVDESGLYQGVPIGRPVCPNHVKGEAKKHWQYLAKQLEIAGLLSTLDQGTFAHLCLYYSKAREAELKIQEDGGEFQETPNGYAQLSPASINFQRYSSMYNKLADKFLLNPAVRQKVRIENPAQSTLDLS